MVVAARGAARASSPTRSIGTPQSSCRAKFHGRQMDNSIRFLTGTAKLFASEPRWSVGRQRNRRDVLFKMWAAMVKDTPREQKKLSSNYAKSAAFIMSNFLNNYLSMTSM